jgi:uncharacterized protein (DUF849 family)
MAKRIISAAVTGGIHTPTMSPYLPVTPEEIANDAIKAAEAGAAVVHIHARDPKTGKPCADMDVYGEIFSRIRAATNAVICATTGGGLGMPVKERVKVVPTHHPEMASFNAGSVNFGLFDIPDRMNVTEWKHDWEKPYLYGTKDLIYTNTFASMEEFAQVFLDSGTKPEVEVFDSGMINNLAYLAEKGLVKKPVYIQFVMGILGGIPAGVENLMFLRQAAQRAFGNDFEWSVCAAGRQQMPMCTAGLLMGSHVRVGMEDSLFIGRGTLATSSAEQVEKIARIARELSIDIATPDEAREILGLSR